MTAINVIRHPDAIYILTDGAGFGEDSQPSALVNKVFPLPHLNAALALRGQFPMLVVLASALSTVAIDTFDELKRLLPSIALQVASGLRPVMVSVEFDLVVGGFSEASGSDSYGVFSHDRHGLAPWKVHQFGEMSVAPQSDEVQAFLWSFPEGMSAKDFTPEVDGLALLNVQRATAEGGRIMGGFAQLTKITRQGIGTRVLERWPVTAGADLRPDFAAATAHQ
jgi:hypothetical protein